MTARKWTRPWLFESCKGWLADTPKSHATGLIHARCMIAARRPKNVHEHVGLSRLFQHELVNASSVACQRMALSHNFSLILVLLCSNTKRQLTQLHFLHRLNRSNSIIFLQRCGHLHSSCYSE